MRRSVEGPTIAMAVYRPLRSAMNPPRRTVLNDWLIGPVQATIYMTMGGALGSALTAWVLG